MQHGDKYRVQVSSVDSYGKFDDFNKPGPEVIKIISCSTEHEILKAHNYENI